MGSEHFFHSIKKDIIEKERSHSVKVDTEGEFLKLECPEKEMVIVNWVGGTVAVMTPGEFAELNQILQSIPNDRNTRKFCHHVLASAAEVAYVPGNGLKAAEWLEYRSEIGRKEYCCAYTSNGMFPSILIF